MTPKGPFLMNHKKNQSKSFFILGTLACIGLSSNITAVQGEIGAESLIASEFNNQNSNPTASQMSLQEVEALRAKLQKKTKELQDYKAKLFRPSHPDDQAKIIALSRRISEYERTKQLAAAEMETLKNDLTQTHKHIHDLEAFSLVLNSIIEGQQALNAAENVEKLEFIAKSNFFERDLNLEKNLSSQLQAELIVLKDLLVLQEKQVVLLNKQRDEEIDSFFLQASVLKSEVDKELHALRENINEITTKNERLQIENETLSKTVAEALIKHEEHYQERQSLALNLLEQEDALTKAVLDYEAAKDEYSALIKSLYADLNEHKENLSVILDEKNTLDQDLQNLKNRIDVIAEENSRLQDENEDLNKTATEALAKHDVHHQELQSLALNLIEKEEALNLANLDYLKIKEEHETYVNGLERELEEHKDNLSTILTEKNAAHQDLHALKCQMDEIDAEKSRLQTENETLNSQTGEAYAKHEEHAEERQSLALRILELEEALNEAKENHRKINDEYANEVKRHEEELKLHEEKLSASLNEKNTIFDDLQDHKNKVDEITAQNLELQDNIESSHKKAADALAKHELHAEEKQALALNLLNLESDLNQAQQDHQTLQNHLSEMITENQRLKNEHEEVNQKAAELSSQNAQHHQEIESLTLALSRQEEVLNEAKNAYQQAKDDYEVKINALADELNDHKEILSTTLSEKNYLNQDLQELQNRISEITSENQRLRNEHEEVNQKAAELSTQNAQHHQENKSLTSALSEHQEALNQVRSDYDNAKHNHETEINQLCSQLEQHKLALSSALSEKDRFASQHIETQDNVDSLKSEVEKLKSENLEAIRKQQEAERAVHSLTLVAQQQDQALAKANSIFSMVQEYNSQLEQEIAILKDRLSESEAAHRKLKKLQESDSEGTEQTTNGVSKALMNLMKNTVSRLK